MDSSRRYQLVSLAVLTCAAIVLAQQPGQRTGPPPACSKVVAVDAARHVATARHGNQADWGLVVKMNA